MHDIITAFQILFKEEILANQLGTIAKIKTVYWWETDNIPLEWVPALMIEWISSNYIPYHQYDRREHPIRITVIMDARNNYGNPEYDVVDHKQELIDLVEWCGVADSIVRPDTILWIIQNNSCLDLMKWLINIRVMNEIRDVSVQYSQTSNKWYNAYEATISLTALATGARY